MARLSPYNAKNSCSKCGSADVRSLYLPHIDQDVGWYDRKYRPVGKWPEEEFIRRTCNSCGYAWPEACLSSGRRALSPAETDASDQRPCSQPIFRLTGAEHE